MLFSLPSKPVRLQPTDAPGDQELMLAMASILSLQSPSLFKWLELLLMTDVKHILKPL